MHEGPEIAAIGILCVALIAGAATRLVSHRTPIPYTVAMLLLGIGMRLGLPSVAGDVALLQPLLHAAVSPELILLVFLPALVFESAFALDVHLFLKNMGLVALLAVPALMVTAVTVGAWAVFVTAGNWEWGWPAALVFGALISATDPVAVVAILREVGAPKRLGVLIEGESLLNDGTAIVLFSVLVGLMGSQAGSFELGATTLELGRVVAGGVLVGLLMGAGCAAWMGRTFEDPMVEITLTLVLAYATVLVAEHALHVSGVLAIVTAGVYLAGPGRTRISPHVSHFLHEFWEMLAYVANTVIFFLVGVVVAANLHRATLGTLWTIGLLYVGAMAVRFVVTYASRAVANPMMRLKLEGREATAMAWGGLRGAVSLALALAVSQRSDVDPALRHQILQVTAGVVLLTILVNGSSTRWLLAWLGFSNIGAAEALASAQTESRVLDRVCSAVAGARDTPGLRTVPWDDVESELAGRQSHAQDRLDRATAAFRDAGKEAREAALWRRVYALERRRYRQEFAAGTLGARALETLEHELDVALDRVDLGIFEPPARYGRGRLRPALERLLRSLGFGFGRIAFGQLSLRYDVARANAQATTDVRDFLKTAGEEDPEVVAKLDAIYQQWALDAREQLEDVRLNVPEVAGAIESRLAQRIALNFEQAAYRHVEREGQVPQDIAEGGLTEVRRRMKALYFTRTRASLPDTVAICRAMPLFQGLDEEALECIARITVEQALAPGEWLFREGDRGDALYIVARGVVAVLHEASDSDDEELVAALGGGEWLGEMALLTGAGRNASARTVTSVTVGRITRGDYLELVREHPAVEEQVWDAFSRRLLDNALRTPGARTTDAERREMVRNATPLRLEDGAAVANDGVPVLVVDGQVEHDGCRYRCGELVHGGGVSVGPSRLLQVPAEERRAASA